MRWTILSIRRRSTSLSLFLWERAVGNVRPGPISLTSLRSRGQTQFKYSFLPPPSETPFKDKIMTLQSRQYIGNAVVVPNDVVEQT